MDSKSPVILPLTGQPMLNIILNKQVHEALASCCNGSIRKLNSLIEKCLILGYQKELQVIDTEIVMSAQNDIELVC